MQGNFDIRGVKLFLPCRLEACFIVPCHARSRFCSSVSCGTSIHSGPSLACRGRRRGGESLGGNGGIS